jgi:hypothetical protein
LSAACSFTSASLAPTRALKCMEATCIRGLIEFGYEYIAYGGSFLPNQLHLQTDNRRETACE